MPDTAGAMPAQSSLGAIQGSNYGGHAPLVGAHIFLLEGTTNGYGGASKSLLQAGETAGPDFYGSTYPTAQDTTGSTTTNPTYGDYYVTTDSHGDFDLNNGYTCDAGYPVYIYAQGGNPQTIPVVSLTSVAISGAGPYTLEFTSSSTQLLYQGEVVVLSGFAGSWAYLNGSTQTVLADSNLTTTTFDISVGTNGGNGTGTYSVNGATATQNTPITSNGAVVNLAVLGICPSSGTANFSQLPFVYMNEVSTAAAAYALGGFFPTPGTTSLTGAGAGAVAANLSIPASDAQALMGLQDAAITADQLYDIAGSNSGTGGDGETHISRTTTPGVGVYAATTSGSTTVTVGSSVGLQVGVTVTGSGIPAGATITAINTGVTPNTITLSSAATATATNVLLRAGAGNGTVPQTLLSTIGNILANCVDSNNTYNPYTGTGTTSTQCSSLFGYAKGGGTTGTTPVDTASAAIDIAHNPWANVSNLVGLPTGNQPFQPTLSVANDFAVGIQYLPAHINNPEGIAVDANGYIWYPNANGITRNGYVTTLTPFGGVLYNTVAATNQIPHYIAIDGNGYAWYGDSYNEKLVGVNATSVLRGSFEYNGTALLNQPYGVAVDGLFGTGYIYVEDLNNASVDYFDGNGNSEGEVPEVATCMGGKNPDHLAFDNGNNGVNLWITSEIGGFFCKPIRTNSTNYTATTYAKYTLSPAASPNAVAIDANGNAYSAANSTDEVVKVPVGSASGTTPTVISTGATLSSPFGVAIDGAGHIFVSNRNGEDISQFTSSGPVSAVNYYGAGVAGTSSNTLFSDPLNIAVDPSGAVWITNYGDTGANVSSIVELLGVGAPTYTPLSLAANNNKLGSKP